MGSVDLVVCISNGVGGSLGGVVVVGDCGMLVYIEVLFGFGVIGGDGDSGGPFQCVELYVVAPENGLLGLFTYAFFQKLSP